MYEQLTVKVNPDEFMTLITALSMVAAYHEHYADQRDDRTIALIRSFRELATGILKQQLAEARSQVVLYKGGEG